VQFAFYFPGLQNANRVQSTSVNLITLFLFPICSVFRKHLPELLGTGDAHTHTHTHTHIHTHTAWVFCIPLECTERDGAYIAFLVQPLTLPVHTPPLTSSINCSNLCSAEHKREPALIRYESHFQLPLL
jgi:hypothetical protein